MIIKSRKPLDDKQLTHLASLIKKPSNMTLDMGGQAVFMNQVNKQTETDLYKADFIATPGSNHYLIVGFWFLSCGLAPDPFRWGRGLGDFNSLYLVGHMLGLSVYTLNIALVIGALLSLDYSLFIINRFREELYNGRTIDEVLALQWQQQGRQFSLAVWRF